MDWWGVINKSGEFPFTSLKLRLRPIQMYQDILLQSSVTIISEKHLFHGVQKRKGPLKVFWHIQITRISFEYSSLTGTRTSYTRLFVVTTRTRTEKFLWRNSNGWWLGGACETDQVDFWLNTTETDFNSHSQQHVEKADREYDDQGRLEWRRVSEFLSIC